MQHVGRLGMFDMVLSLLDLIYCLCNSTCSILLFLPSVAIRHQTTPYPLSLIIQLISEAVYMYLISYAFEFSPSR